MTTHVMLDLETFGTSPSAAIVQVGAVRFDLTSADLLLKTVNDRERTLDGFERTVALQSSILAGGGVDQETVAWWREADRETARIAIESNAERLGIVLGAFTRWYPPGAYLWSHGAAFDVPVLASAYRSLGLAAPWDYRLIRDTRTLYELALRLAGWVKPARPTAHTALADAIAQAEDVRAAHAALTAPPDRSINLNDRVRVTLTAAGAAMWRQHYGFPPPPAVLLPLWEVASVFGQALYHGNPEPPFEGMELEVVP